MLQAFSWLCMEMNYPGLRGTSFPPKRRCCFASQAPRQPAMAGPELLLIAIDLAFNLNLRLAFWGLSQDQENQSQQPEPLCRCSRVKWEKAGTRSWGYFVPVFGANVDREPSARGLWEPNSPYSQSSSVEPQNLKHILMPHFLSMAPE